MVVDQVAVQQAARSHHIVAAVVEELQCRKKVALLRQMPVGCTGCYFGDCCDLAIGRRSLDSTCWTPYSIVSLVLCQDFRELLMILAA